MSRAAKASGAATRKGVIRVMPPASRLGGRRAVGPAGVVVRKFPHTGCVRPYDGPMVIAAAALLAGLADFILVLSSDHFTDRAWAAFGPLVGWSFVGTGVYAQRRRPES